MKHSTFKNVKSFLKASAKEGLLKLKETKGDVVVTAVHPQHPAVAGKRPHRTIGDLEAKAKKEEDREQKEKGTIGYDFVSVCPPYVLGPILHDFDGKAENINHSNAFLYNAVIKGEFFPTE